MEYCDKGTLAEWIGERKGKDPDKAFGFGILSTNNNRSALYTFRTVNSETAR